MNARAYLIGMKVATVFAIAVALMICKAAIDMVIDMNKEPTTWQEAQKKLDAISQERFKDELPAVEVKSADAIVEELMSSSEVESADAIIEGLMIPNDGSGAPKPGCVYR
jgi:hypothetical protein